MQVRLDRHVTTQVLWKALATAPCVQFHEQYAAYLLPDARKLDLQSLPGREVDPNLF